MYANAYKKSVIYVLGFFLAVENYSTYVKIGDLFKGLNNAVI